MLGRWASLGTLKSYLQEAMSYWIWFSIPTDQSARMQAWLEGYSRVLRAPPTVPFLTLVHSASW